MANSDSRFLYTDDDGMLIVMCPADKIDMTLDEIKDKYCPKDRPVYTVDKSVIPTDRSFRNAWTYSE